MRLFYSNVPSQAVTIAILVINYCCFETPSSIFVTTWGTGYLFI